MKAKVAIVFLVLVCVGLGVALVTQNKKAEKDRTERDTQITQQSNVIKETKAKLEEQTQVNMSLEGDLKTRASELTVLSNSLNKVIADLEKSDAQAKATAEQLRTAQGELAKKDAKINELEVERAALGKQMDTLTNSITDLEKLIVTTQKKLVNAEGDKAFLLKELKRLQAEKAELERQFNDLAVMRAQVSRLKEELAISRRLEFLRLNLFGSAKGGAEKLMPHMDKNPANRAALTNSGLTVELSQTSGARIVTATNVPAATNAVPKPPAPAPAPAPNPIPPAPAPVPAPK